MLIKNEQYFSTNKLMLLFSIAWLLQLKKIPNNQLKMNENFFIEENKNGLVSIKFYLGYFKIAYIKCLY